MRKINSINFKVLILLGGLLMINSGCERDLSEDAVPATYDTTGDIFIDAPIGLGSFFYFPFGPDETNPVGSLLDAFSVDESESYEGTASIRFDVPNASNPEGNYAGGIFAIDGAGRNLTDYDAFTFWAKASQAVTIAQIGFGEDFGENKYKVLKKNLTLSTRWEKYIIPIPDPSKLVEERGMLTYAAAPVNGLGYTFWIDELKFEKLGTVAQPRPAIFDGQDLVERSFLGATRSISGLTQTFNTASGQDVTVDAAPSYFTFASSNTNVATVNELGVVSIIGTGTTKITATLGNVKAEGSLDLEVLGAFTLAPVPTRDPSNVISIYSDAYENVPVDFFNGFWEPFQTTESSFFVANGNSMIHYTNFNFVGNQFANPTVDASQMTHLHINMYIPDEVPDDLDFLITVVDFGADGAEGGDGANADTREQLFFFADSFTADTWATLEVPITLANRSNLGLIIYENINNPTTSEIDNFYLDNIYFYRN